jgi:hypothetical protein
MESWSDGVAEWDSAFIGESFKSFFGTGVPGSWLLKQISFLLASPLTASPVTLGRYFRPCF